MQSSPTFWHFLPLRFKYVLSTGFSNTFNLCYSLNVRDQVSNPYEKQAKLVLYIIILQFFWEKRGRQKILK
jgi:hypothetical protein